MINCDSWHNYDSKSFNGSDDGGDADSFAAKLFPGPGTEFHGQCRAWTNSDDSWDLYMVYHQSLQVLELDAEELAMVQMQAMETASLGGGGSSEEQRLRNRLCTCDHKTTLHLTAVTKVLIKIMPTRLCTFSITWPGNNTIIVFPSIFQYGTMYMRNNIGFKPTVRNHRIPFRKQEGSQVPTLNSNSWTTFDDCDPYKDGNKVEV